MTESLGPGNKEGFQVAVSSLTLGSLYEAILEFSGHERQDTFWPAVCRNTRWLIPSRRMCVVLNTGADRYDVIGFFAGGKFVPASNPDFQPTTRELARAVTSANAQWLPDPAARFSAETASLCERMFDGAPEWLFVLPVRTKDVRIGALLFATGSVGDADRAMLNTLGTIYALHVGMSLELIRAADERKKLQERMVMQERMASLGNLVAGVAHEVNTPIGSIIAAADVSLRCIRSLHGVLEQAVQDGDIPEDPKVQKACDLMLENNTVIADAGRRIADIVRSLKNFARLDEAEFQMTDIHDGIESTFNLVQHEFRGKVTVVREFGELPRIECYPSQVNQLLMNLFVNAAQAIDDHGTLTVTTSADTDSVRVVVADTGRGIPAEHIGKIFEPGFTTKGGLGVGTGLGLSLCYNIVQKHGGSITVDSEVGRGTAFSVTLPKRQPRSRSD